MSRALFQSNPSSRLTRTLLGVGMLLVGGWIWGGMFVHVRDVEANVAYPVFEVAPEPLQLTVAPGQTVRGAVRRGQSLFGLLSRYGLDKTQMSEVLRVAKPFQDLNRIRVGQTYRLSLDEHGKFRDFELDYNASRTLKVVVTPFGFVADSHDIAFETRVKYLSGSARVSLFADLMNEVGGAELIRKMQDIFAWRLDFRRDIRKGDSYQVMVEEVWRDGRFDHFGNVRFARIQSRGNTLEGIRYNDEYFDAEGRPLRNILLPAPLDYQYISSRFSTARRHPVYGTVRPHMGVDFVAPYGTPVRAAGDGVVNFSGWKGANGRLVSMRHNGVYRTVYAHLSKFAKGVHRGSRVKQGQVIGYVGNSGTSTGTHLHYGVYRNGRVVDPLKLDYTPVEVAVSAVAIGEFQLLLDNARLTLTRMEEGAQPILARL